MRLQVITELQHGQSAKPYTIERYEIDPDSFYRKTGAVPFIYHPDGTLQTSGHDRTHLDIIVQNSPTYGLDDWGFETFQELQLAHIKGMQAEKAHQADCNPYESPYYGALEARKKLKEEQIALLGRIGNYITTAANGDNINAHMLAFWNDSKMPDLVTPCLKDLFHQKLITLDTIYANGNKRMSVRDYLRGGRFDENPEEAERKALMQQLHLMPPQQKKAAMKKLKLAGGGHKPGWQKATEKHNLVRPGQKWWAMQSEDTNE